MTKKLVERRLIEIYSSLSISLHSTSATREIHRKLKTSIITCWLLTREIELASAMVIDFIPDLCMNHPWETCHVCLSVLYSSPWGLATAVHVWDKYISPKQGDVFILWVLNGDTVLISFCAYSWEAKSPVCGPHT